jgi:exodeoxyribonuclease VII small subunit
MGNGNQIESDDTPTALKCRRSGGQVVLFSAATLCLILCLPVSSKPKQRETELNFEGAMDRLEAIVEQMESGKLPLEELIVRYEEGMNLVKICQERLANAEQKIEIIARNSAGKTVVKDFELTQEAAAAASAADESESTNDEIKLF